MDSPLSLPDHQIPRDLESALETLYQRQRARAWAHRDLDPAWRTRTLRENLTLLESRLRRLGALLHPLVDDPLSPASPALLGEALDLGADLANYVAFAVSSASRNHLLG